MPGRSFGDMMLAVCKESAEGLAALSSSTKSRSGSCTEQLTATVTRASPKEQHGSKRSSSSSGDRGRGKSYWNSRSSNSSHKYTHKKLKKLMTMVETIVVPQPVRLQSFAVIYWIWWGRAINHMVVAIYGCVWKSCCQRSSSGTSCAFSDSTRIKHIDFVPFNANCLGSQFQCE